MLGLYLYLGLIIFIALTGIIMIGYEKIREKIKRNKWGVDDESFHNGDGKDNWDKSEAKLKGYI